MTSMNNKHITFMRTDASVTVNLDTYNLYLYLVAYLSPLRDT